MESEGVMVTRPAKCAVFRDRKFCRLFKVLPIFSCHNSKFLEISFGR